jgi:hypothetical protein
MILVKTIQEQFLKHETDSSLLKSGSGENKCRDSSTLLALDD